MRLPLALLAFLIPLSAGADLYVVRNSDTCDRVGGTCYVGYDAVVWADVASDGKLIHCGHMTAADADNATNGIQFDAGGFVLDGDCSAFGYPAQGSLDVGADRQRAMHTVELTGVTVQNLDLFGGTTVPLQVGTDASTDKDFTFRDGTIGRSQATAGENAKCASTRGQDVAFERVTFEGCPNDALFHQGKGLRLTDVIMREFSTGTSSGDGLQLTGAVDGYVLDGVDVDMRGGSTKGAINVGSVTDSGSGIVKGATVRCPDGAGTAVGIDLSGGTAKVHGAYVVGCSKQFQFTSLTNFELLGSVGVGNTDRAVSVGASVSGTGTIANNTFAHGVNGVWSDQSGSGIGSKNNIIAGMSGACIEKQDADNVDDNNLLHDCGTEVTVATTADDAAESTVRGDPLFVGGTSPNTVAGFRLKATSPGIDAGKWIGTYQDFSGRQFAGIPEIGAYAYQGGSPRITTTARRRAEARVLRTVRDAPEVRP